MRRILVVFCLAFFLTAGLPSCVLSERHDPEKRRQRLLELYPPGKTTRVDVQKKWGTQPVLSETRPVSGWDGSARPVQEHVAKSEQRTGQAVYRFERYWGPDGASGGLCYCWFYYDVSDRVVDVEWQYSSD